MDLKIALEAMEYWRKQGKSSISRRTAISHCSRPNVDLAPAI